MSLSAGGVFVPLPAQEGFAQCRLFRGAYNHSRDTACQRCCPQFFHTANSELARPHQFRPARGIEGYPRRHYRNEARMGYEIKSHWCFMSGKAPLPLDGVDQMIQLGLVSKAPDRPKSREQIKTIPKLHSEPKRTSALALTSSNQNLLRFYGKPTSPKRLPSNDH